MRRRAFVILSAAGLAACSPLAGANPLGLEERRTLRISDFTVRTTGTSFASSRAQEFSSRLAPDLRAALRQEFAERTSPGGASVVVDIASLNLSGSTATAFGRDQSRLRGQLTILAGDGTTARATYAIDVVAGSAAQTTTGALASAAVNSDDGFYRRLLSSFALDAREQVIGQYLPGERIVRQATN